MPDPFKQRESVSGESKSGWLVAHPNLDNGFVYDMALPTGRLAREVTWTEAERLAEQFGMNLAIGITLGRAHGV